jgi:hypothetical protein
MITQYMAVWRGSKCSRRVEDIGAHELQVRLDELALEPPRPHPVHEQQLHTSNFQRTCYYS